LSFRKKIIPKLAHLNEQPYFLKENKLEKIITKNNKKIARTRRQRGYNWEDTIVKRFNWLNDWKAFRLGSPSVALPDIMAINNKKSIIFTIEAKSGTSTSLQVPYDQIFRCINWNKHFELYETQKVVLAFKFLSKKRIGVGKYETRQLREFYKIWDTNDKPLDLVCTYNGGTYALNNGKRMKKQLPELIMPFKSKYQTFFKDTE
jgi:Holliday junction resolvase